MKKRKTMRISVGILLVVLITAVFGFSIIAAQITPTGRAYGREFGPLGQYPGVYSVDRLQPPPRVAGVRVYVCCDARRIAELGQSGCPTSQPLFDQACAGSYTFYRSESYYKYPPCSAPEVECEVPYG